MGANYIHGILGNPMYELALNHGLIDITHTPKDHQVLAVMEDGNQIPFLMLQEVYEAYTCFLRRCEEYFLSQFLPPEGISNVGDHIKLEVALYLDRINDNKEKHIKHLIFDSLLKRETCITGCNDMNEVNLIELGSYIELQGGNIVLPGGYSSVLQAVTLDIPPENIVLNHCVTKINWISDKCKNECCQGTGYDSGIDLLANGEVNNDSDSDGALNSKKNSSCKSKEEKHNIEQIPLNNSNDSNDDNDSKLQNLEIFDIEKELDVVEVICENGVKFYGSHVICTIPLGVLKEKSDTLFSPKLPQDKLDSIKKLSFGTVDKIFLEYSRPFLHDNVTEVMLLWDNENVDENLETCWFKKIHAFSKVSETLLLGWISGEEAKFMEKLPNQVVGEKCTEILRKFLNDPYIPLPKTCTTSKWHSNEHFRGSYSSISVEASHLDIEVIAKPLFSHLHKKKVRF